MNIWVVIAIVCVGVLASIVMLLSSSKWESTTAEIQLLAFHKQKLTNVNKAVGKGPNRYFHDIDIKYTFTVDHINYTGSRFIWGLPNVTADLGLIEKMKGDYAVGKTVDVFYDPSNPSRSSLQKVERSWKTYFFFGFIILLVSLFGFVFFMLKKHVF